MKVLCRIHFLLYGATALHDLDGPTAFSMRARNVCTRAIPAYRFSRCSQWTDYTGLKPNSAAVMSEFRKQLAVKTVMTDHVYSGTD